MTAERVCGIVPCPLRRLATDQITIVKACITIKVHAPNAKKNKTTKVNPLEVNRGAIVNFSRDKTKMLIWIK
jgi:hypothetical protein